MNHTDLLREKFEAWASDDGKYPRAIERTGANGTYQLLTTEVAWSNWLACSFALKQDAQVQIAELTRQRDELKTALQHLLIVAIPNVAPNVGAGAISAARAALESVKGAA